MLEAGGHQALFVGGCVRNTLLGEPVTDIDIATDAFPERVTDLAEGAGLKPVPTGIDHGTITVVAGGTPHEVTTFRHDLETDGRRAVVAFTDEVAEDAREAGHRRRHVATHTDGCRGAPGLARRPVQRWVTHFIQT